MGNCLVFAAAQMLIVSVTCTRHPSSLARGVYVGLLRGSTPQTLYSLLSIDVSLSILLLLVLCRSLEGWALENPHGIPQFCSLSLLFRLELLLGLTAGLSLGKFV